MKTCVKTRDLRRLTNAWEAEKAQYVDRLGQPFAASAAAAAAFDRCIKDLQAEIDATIPNKPTPPPEPPPKRPNEEVTIMLRSEGSLFSRLMRWADEGEWQRKRRGGGDGREE